MRYRMFSRTTSSAVCCGRSGSRPWGYYLGQVDGCVKRRDRRAEMVAVSFIPIGYEVVKHRRQAAHEVHESTSTTSRRLNPVYVITETGVGYRFRPP